MLAQPEDFGVWLENWDVLDLFLRLQTQWRTGPMGGVIGLDYGGVEALFRLCGVKKKAEIFDMIQAMEFAALPVLNKKKD
jgi:Phage related hypothetical protein (DUF1799)